MDCPAACVCARVFVCVHICLKLKKKKDSQTFPVKGKEGLREVWFYSHEVPSQHWSFTR